MQQQNEDSPKGYWVHLNGKFALWWNQHSSQWEIGKVGSKAGTILGPSNNGNLPTTINEWKWKWFGNTKSHWINAGFTEIQFREKDMSTTKFWIDATSSEMRFKDITNVKTSMSIKFICIRIHL